MTSLRIFFIGGLTAYRALINWLSPWIFIPTLVITPIFQILLFVYIGRSAGVQSDSFFVIGNAVQYASVPCLFSMTNAITGERWQQTLGAVLATPARRLPLFLGRAFPVVGNGILVTAFALASGTSLAAFGTAAPAGAATSHAPAYYQGVTSANVLSVALHLPSALPALTTMSPASGSPGEFVSVALTGNVFIPGATTLAVGGSGVTAAAVNVVNNTTMNAVQPAGAHSRGAPLTENPSSLELRQRNNTVLTRGKPGNEGVRIRVGAFMSRTSRAEAATTCWWAQRRTTF